MKLIVAGATGLVGSEIIKLSLEIPEITSVIALARKPVQVEGGRTPSKVKSVIIKDYGEYSDDAKAEFAGADACIWTVAVTPIKASRAEFEEVKRVCQTYTMLGINAMYAAGPAKKFRFIYFSAEGTPRDLTKKPPFMAEYQLMRGETENMVLDFAKKRDGIDVCVAQPGVVRSSATYTRSALGVVLKAASMLISSMPTISRTELAAAVLDQSVQGWEKEPLSNADLVRIGREALKRYAKAS